MGKKKKHRSTKNTMPKPPVTRLCEIEGDCNGSFKIVTDFASEKERAEFDKIYLQWFDSPHTVIWNIESFIIYFKRLFPKRICLLHSDYKSITKGKVIPATKEEWEQENN